MKKILLKIVKGVLFCGLCLTIISCSGNVAQQSDSLDENGSSSEKIEQSSISSHNEEIKGTTEAVDEEIVDEKWSGLIWEETKESEYAMCNSEIRDNNVGVLEDSEEAFELELMDKTASAQVTFDGENKYFVMCIENSGESPINIDLGNKGYRIGINTKKYICATSEWDKGTYTFYFGTSNSANYMDGKVLCNVMSELP